MDSLDEIQTSLDVIEESLKRFSSNSPEDSLSVQGFHDKIKAIFPLIHYENSELLWIDKETSPEKLTPLWWDELDEPFELDYFHWLIPIQKMKLLRPEESIELLNAIEAGVLAQEALEENIHLELKSKYDKEKFLQVIAIGRASYDEFISKNLKLVVHIARKFNKKMDLEDAFSYGVFGLIRAVEKFDWRLGNQFSTYATWWIRQSITREIADTSTTIGIPVHAVEMVSTYKKDIRLHLESSYPPAGEITIRDKSGAIRKVTPSMKPPVFKKEMNETLLCALAASAPSFHFWDVYVEAPWLLEKFEVPELFFSDYNESDLNEIAKDLAFRLTDFVLSKRELEVLLSRNGIINGEPQTLDEIGLRFGLTRERIRQIESKAKQKLNVFFDGMGISEYWDKIEDATKLYEDKIQKDVSLQFRSIKRQQCGTEKGYQQHIENYEEVCNHCKRGRRLKKYNFDEVSTKVAKSKEEVESNLIALIASNEQRSLKSALNQVLQVEWALQQLSTTTLTALMKLAADARLKYPEASLSELAINIGESVNKNMVSGSLRRLIKLAIRKSGEQPPRLD